MMHIHSPNLPQPQSAYDDQALAFCREWLAGQSEFRLQTSGSTGQPKPITLSRRQMRASAQLTGQTLGLRAGDRALVCLNVRYIAGVMMLVRGLELGLPMTVVEPTANPLEKFDSANDRFELAAFVPLQLQTLLEQPDRSLPILNWMKAILVGGAAVDPALEEQIQRIEAPVFSTYGMTETVSHIALRRLNGPVASDVFTTLEGVAIGVDGRNCLHITSAATDFQRVQTNDVVALLDPRRFRILGRADSIINSGGVKIQPEQLEAVVGRILAQAGNRQRFFVFGLPDQRLGQQVVLFVEGAEPTADQQEAIREAIRSGIGPYAVPRRMIAVPGFLETPTGKIDRNATAAQTD